MIRLGNIDYTNCYPIHAALLDGEGPTWLRIVHGPPSRLNAMLAAGELDVAPCSSIEAVRHASEYVVLAGLCIGSDGPVKSITLVSRVPLPDLDGAVVALPTASATSRCLARILLETRLGIQPQWADFDQRAEDPLVDGRRAVAALFIGDVALQRPVRPGETVVDLGAEWKAWTGLPFVFALWQARSDLIESPELASLHRALIGARDRLDRDAISLASRASERFGIDSDRLGSYWRTVAYGLDEHMLEGLRHFYRLAAELGDAPAGVGLEIVEIPDG